MYSGSRKDPSYTVQITHLALSILAPFVQLPLFLILNLHLHPLPPPIGTGICGNYHRAIIYTLLPIFRLISKQYYWLPLVLFPGTDKVQSSTPLFLKVKLTPTSRLFVINASLCRSPIVIGRGWSI